MGHTRLGTIPKSKKWDAVVTAVMDTMGEGYLSEAVPAIASHAAEAASGGMARAAQDPGVVYAFYTLAQLSLSTRRRPDQANPLGFDPLAQESVYDLLAEVQLSLDEYVAGHGGTTDYSEMAQRAVGDALLELLDQQTLSLFGGGKDEVRDGLRVLSQRSTFSYVSQHYFGGFLARFLNFYLSRVTVRSTEYSEFRQVAGFNDELRLYAFQSAAIVKDFATMWLSKADYEGRVTVEETQRFMAVVGKKLSAELTRIQAEHDRP